ncbi:MAG: hypothetical protein OK454_06865 [Thaumarchaeota archaeon]|nr:hypothetical protein [Nitrososphaerota archaeon]
MSSGLMDQEGIHQGPGTVSKSDEKESDGGSPSAREKKTLGRRIKEKLHKK